MCVIVTNTTDSLCPVSLSEMSYLAICFSTLCFSPESTTVEPVTICVKTTLAVVESMQTACQS